MAKVGIGVATTETFSQAFSNRNISRENFEQPFNVFGLEKSCTARILFGVA